jgi:ferredoxin
MRGDDDGIAACGGHAYSIFQLKDEHEIGFARPEEERVGE